MGQKTQTTAAVACMKTLLMIFNFVFFITGIAILGLGVYTKLKLTIYTELMDNYYTNTPYIMIGIGSFVVVLGFMGCYCTAKGNVFLLYIYSAILFIIFIAELAAGISAYIFKGKIFGSFERGIDNAMANFEEEGSEDVTQAMNDMQTHLHCCGSFNYTSWFTTEYGSANMQVPKSCCKSDIPKNQTCVHTNLTPEEATDIYTDGCHTKVVDTVHDNIAIIAGAATGFAFIQLFGLILTCCLAKSISKHKYESVS